ncbi:MAG: hypothetical protein AAF465_06710 [Pseudomonadota bacterium]
MKKKRGIAWLRQMLMFYVLIAVALSAWLARERSTDWNNTLWVAVFPINGDQSDAAAAYITDLHEDDFAPIETFFQTELNRYGLSLDQPVRIDLRDQLGEKPPSPPEGSALSVIKWSLVMRHWAWKMERSQDGVTPDIKLFVVYYDPARHTQLPHSVGVQKGLFGIINAFASRQYRGSNQVVIAHELLHTLGATDKYDLQTVQPVHPDGFADPDAKPLFPQHRAELMGGRIPISPERAEIPRSLRQVMVGPLTAREIRWTQ